MSRCERCAGVSRRYSTFDADCAPCPLRKWRSSGSGLSVDDILIFGGHDARSEALNWLDNFFPSELLLPDDPKPWPTVEHAFQAAKARDNVDWRERVRDAPTPKDAQRLGRQIPMSEDDRAWWAAEGAVEAMRAALRSVTLRCSPAPCAGSSRRPPLDAGLREAADVPVPSSLSHCLAMRCSRRALVHWPSKSPRIQPGTTRDGGPLPRFAHAR